MKWVINKNQNVTTQIKSGQTFIHIPIIVEESVDLVSQYNENKSS